METKIIKALSGTEIKNALLTDFERMLNGDDRLNPHVAYHSVAYDIVLQVRTPLNVPAGFDRKLEGTVGEEIAPGEEIMNYRYELNQETTSPNGLREQTEQPIPVLVTDSQGRSREELVSYKGQPKRMPGRPKKVSE